MSHDTTVCPRCGADNRCRFGSGEACWCATEVAHRLPPQPGTAVCYCRRCLEELLGERAATNAIT